MNFWQIIYGIDWVLFGIVGYTVFYLAFYAVAGMFRSAPSAVRLTVSVCPCPSKMP